jgi:hypothetical protein
VENQEAGVCGGICLTRLLRGRDAKTPLASLNPWGVVIKARLAFRVPQLGQRDLKLKLCRQGNGAGAAHFQAHVAARETAKGMRHNRPPGFEIPIEDVVRTEIEALEVGAAGVGVNAGKPWEFFAEIAQQGHSFNLYESHE